MGQEFITVSKAAQMLGISRHDLQKLIHDGELISMDGKIDLHELRIRYPQIDVNDASAHERYTMIKASAFGRRVRQTIVPEVDEIELQLQRRTVELSIARARAKKYKEMLHELTVYLGNLQLDVNADQKQVIYDINRWISRKMCE